MKASESEQSNIKDIYEIMIDTNMMFKASIILYERYLNPNFEAFLAVIITLMNFTVDHQAPIIQGLNSMENIGTILLELATRLLIVTKAITEAFFAFFSIVFNSIFSNTIATVIWAAVSPYWLQIILTMSAFTVIIGLWHIGCWIYNRITRSPSPPKVINAIIDDDELLIG